MSPAKPKPGDRTTLRMRVTTTGSGTRDVPWEIKVGNKVLGRGTRRQLRAGQKFDVSASWTAAAGLHNFLGSADPRNTFREQGRDRFDNARGFSVRVEAATAQTDTRRGGNTRGNQNQSGSKQSERFEVGVQSLTASPNSLIKGQKTNLVMVIKTGGDDDARRDVEWVFKNGNQTIRKGVKRNVRAGQSFAVTHSWNSPYGQFLVEGIADPENKLKENKRRQANNLKRVGVRKSNWAEWGPAALSGAVTGIRIWQTQAKLRNIKVMAVSAIGTPGCLTGPSIKSHIKNALLAKSCPDDLAEKISKSIADAFKAWQDKVTVPGLPWYPAFAAFPGPSAPPMPNVPTPLASLVSSGKTEMTPQRLKQRIEGAIGAAKNDPNAAPAIALITTKLSARFFIWIGQLQVMNVLGKGPVPTFAPPYVPVGPVVAGSVIVKPGSFITSQFPNTP